MAGSSLLQLAKRSLVSVLLRLAAIYGLDGLHVTRESPDGDVQGAYRKVLRRVHPDKGGATRHAQELNAAKGNWDAVRQRHGGRANAQAAASGRSGGGGFPCGGRGVAPARAVVAASGAERGFRIESTSVLLTYNGIRSLAHWRRLNAWVRKSAPAWGLRHWCSTLEESKRRVRHAHLMLQFHSKIDRHSKYFVYDGIAPNAQPNGVGADLCGEGICRRKVQQSIDRGMFYVWADKVGTVRDARGSPCRDGNYTPAWTLDRTTYQVKSVWPETLWKQYKLTHGMYEQYLYQTRDGVVAKKRNLDAVLEHEQELEDAAEVDRVTKRIRADRSVYRPFPKVPAAVAWLQGFAADRLRYPLLLVLGESSKGKTEWAVSLFRRPLKLLVGSLKFFPEGMRKFNRKIHDGLVLDDVRDLMFISDHQEKLQGKYDTRVEFASTPGGVCSFSKYLFACPTVVTLNYSTQNLHFLEHHYWLKSPANRVVIHWPPPEERPGVGGP